MGLRCLLGHDFGEPETERERTEEGNEVVVTVREVKTCQRCGEKQVVSENKEITSIEQLRESATGESTPPTGPSTSPEPSPAAGSGTADEWGTDELSPGGDAGASEPTPGVDEATTADAEPTEGSSAAVADADEDPVERGVADIIEQAERDDDMLEGPAEPPEADETADDGDDVPVHPGQRSAAAEESEIPDAEEDDGVILDEDGTEPPENARKQWEEEASPEEVPDQDPIVEADAAADEEYDAEIIDAESDPSAVEPDADPAEPTDRAQATDPGEPSESAAADTRESSTPAAVESEDAEIVDADPGPADPDPETPVEAETDEGHMPWPDAPGEDEGHDATVPDGEPADIDFGEGFSPTEEEPDTTESAAADPEPVETDSHTGPDRDNGDRTPTGESSDASAAPTANVDLERSSRDAELEYYCPECGLTRDVGNSSMRAGDICPECRVGYITEQQKAE